MMTLVCAFFLHSRVHIFTLPVTFLGGTISYEIFNNCLSIFCLVIHPTVELLLDVSGWLRRIESNIALAFQDLPSVIIVLCLFLWGYKYKI